MEQKQILKQMVDFQKMTFENTFDVMMTLHNQGQKMVDMSIEKSPWIPATGKKIFTDWSDAYQKNSNDFKEFVDANFEKMQEYFPDLKTDSASKASAASKTDSASKASKTDSASKASKTDSASKVSKTDSASKTATPKS